MSDSYFHGPQKFNIIFEAPVLLKWYYDVIIRYGIWHMEFLYCRENAYLKIGLIVLFSRSKKVLIIKKLGKKLKIEKKSVMWSPKDNHHL